MRKIVLKLFSLFFVILVYIVISPKIFADTICTEKYACDKIQDTSDRSECIQKKLDECDRKIRELAGKENSLQNEIQYMDGQIDLAELKIQNSLYKIKKTEDSISKLADGIDDMSGRINNLIKSMDYQKIVLSSRMRERYKSKEDSVLTLLLGGETLDKIIQKTEYLKIMELQDNKLLDQMKKTRNDYDTQKKLLQDKKSDQEDLKKQLIAEKINLDSYKDSLEDSQIEKKKLLEITQNKEEEYQRLKQEAQAELNQIVGAASVLKNAKGVKVDKGDLIGIQGNSGYSFGAHLHFGVYKYSSFNDIDGWNWYYSNYVNPLTKLSSRSVYWDTGCETAKTRSVGSGDWKWPMTNTTVTQGFGHTCWSSRYYGGKDHPALDMAGPANSPIYAAADGTAYTCRNCLGDGGNGVFIFHKNGYMTVYWHLK